MGRSTARPTTNRIEIIGLFDDHSTDNTAAATESASTTTPDELVIPEDLSALNDEELAALHAQASEAFDALYGEGQGFSDDDLEQLASLTEAIESIQATQDSRTQQAAEREARAAEMASRVRNTSEERTEDSDDAETVETDPLTDAEQPADETVTEPVVQAAAASTGPVRVNLSRARQRQHRPAVAQAPAGPTVQDVLVASGSGHGFEDGTGLTVSQAAAIVSKRLQGYNHSQFAAAASRGQSIRQRHSVARINKIIDPSLTITNDDPQHVEEILRLAADESRLPGNSLVASGGWCAPPETMYGLLELESRDGLFSLPTTVWARGGIRRTLGPDFASIYALAVGFHYTEEHDLDGTYAVDENGMGTGEEGSKPCIRVECPEWEDFTLEVDGLCVQAGLWMQRTYPELLARTIRGVLVAHDHRMSGRRLANVEAGSTAVTMPTPAGGAIAPVLNAIELQVQHMRNLHKLADSTTLEAVFPKWVHGLIRSDLARRDGVDVYSITDAQINAWFTLRGVAPQFVGNWQDINGITAENFTAWPDEVTFLLYPAGTWVEGTSPIITLDTIYDSVLLGQNDYTALFTEEANKIVKMGHDSRAVTVPTCPNGAVGGSITIACDGTAPVVETEPTP